MSSAFVSANRWICLDVGETLIDETRVWTTWAALLGVPAFIFMAAIGATVGRSNEHQDAFAMVGRPDWRDLRGTFETQYGGFQASDVYPDAIDALAAFRDAGFHVAIIANQQARRNAELRAIGVTAEVMAMSDEMSLWKPDPQFFARSLELMGNAHPSDVAYVGDRLDNDVRPSIAAGMRAVWLRRGPWGVIGDRDGPPAATTLIVDSLSELVGRLDELWTGRPSTVAAR